METGERGRLRGGDARRDRPHRERCDKRVGARRRPAACPAASGGTPGRARRSSAASPAHHEGAQENRDVIVVACNT
ncbi:hypothetical protein ACRAWF_34865 [Streptomyces sp. L7]